MQPRRTQERVALAGAIAFFLFAKLLKYLGHVPITRSLFRTLNGSCLPAAAAAAAAAAVTFHFTHGCYCAVRQGLWLEPQLCIAAAAWNCRRVCSCTR